MGGILIKRVDPVRQWEEMVEEDRQRAIQRKLEAELKKIKQEKLVEAVTAAATHVFQYAPITVQIRNTEDEHGVKQEETYLWVTVDLEAMTEAAAQEQYPLGVAVNKGGHMHVPAYLTYPARDIPYDMLPVAFIPPEVPHPPRLKVATSSSIAVEWRKVDPMEDQYELQFYPLQRERYGAQIWRTASNSIVDTEFTINDLPHNMPFQFRMRAHNPYGWSGFSALSDAYATTPSPPEALDCPPVATILDGGTVRLEWPPVQEDNGAPVEVYNVRAKVVGAESVYELVHSGPDTFCELPDLKAGEIYHFQVAACNAFGASEYSEAGCATIPMQHQGLGNRVVPPNALRVMGDWVELWHEDTQSVSYLHLKTGVKRKKPPKERSTTPRSHVRARSASALVRPGSPLIAGSLASSPRSVGSRSLGGSSRSRTPRTPRRNPLDAMRSQSARVRTLSPLRLRTISHIRRPGSFTGSVGSVFSDESKGAPASPDTPQSVFRKKRYRFLCGLRRRQTRQRPGTPTTMGSGVLFLPLDRDNMFIQSYEKLRNMSSGDLKRKLRIDYTGEEGIDAGGLTKDWYLQVSREMFKTEHVLFKRIDSDHRIYTIHPRACVRGESNSYFRFIGRLLAKAVHDVQLVDLPWAHLLYKHILGQKVGLEELAEMDQVFVNSLTWMLDNDITDIIHETFSVEEHHDGEEHTVELKPGGEHIDVTEDNKQEYVDLVIEYKTHRSMAVPLEALKQGFYDVIPWEAIRVFSVDELELLLNGKPEIDIEDLQRNIVYQGGCTEQDFVIKMFWEVMEEFDQGMRGQVLQFITGTSRVPLDGFIPPLTFVAATDLGPSALPKAHTCFNQVVLPPYPDKERLLEKLTYAVEHADGFLLG